MKSASQAAAVVAVSSSSTSTTSQHLSVSASEEEWMRPRALAERTGLHIQTIRRLIRQRKIPFLQVDSGQAILIEWHAFLRAYTKLPQRSN